MNLKDIGEFGLIERLSQGCLIRPGNVVRAIGDDAAAFITAPGMVTLLTTDLLVERVHFFRGATTGFNLGCKALAVNLSDIAAMGGVAREAFVSIAIPEDCPVSFVEEIYHGIKMLAGRFEVNVLGGDTTGSKTDLVLNVAVTGEVEKAQMMRRDAARPGDRVACTGFLGDSRAGLHMILNRISPETEELAYLFNAHILPEPHLRQGRLLASEPGVHACIDVSDGLSSDLGHITRASGVGAKIFFRELPISRQLTRFCRRFGFDPAAYALAGGEDYVLLCTVSSDTSGEIAEKFRKTFGSPLFFIGEITDSDEVTITGPDGRTRGLPQSGWDHFKPG